MNENQMSLGVDYPVINNGRYLCQYKVHMSVVPNSIRIYFLQVIERKKPKIYNRNNNSSVNRGYPSLFSASQVQLPYGVLENLTESWNGTRPASTICDLPAHFSLVNLTESIVFKYRSFFMVFVLLE